MSIRRLSSHPSFRAFSHPAYVKVWWGGLISTLGTWMELVALGIYVTETTGRAEWMGRITALAFLPSIVLVPLAGTLADRFDRRAYLAVCTLAQAVIAGALAVLAATGRLTLTPLAILCVLHGCMSALTLPVFSAMTAVILPSEQLHSGLSLDLAQANLGRIFGPALAALILTRGGVAWAFVFNTVSFVAVLVALAWMGPVRRGNPRPGEGLWRGVKRGLLAAREDVGIAAALGGTLGVAVLISPFIALVPVLALRVLHGDAATASLLTTVQGVGAVTAAVLAGTLAERWGRGALLERTMLLLGPVAAAYWLSPNVPIAGVFLFVLGALYLLAVGGLRTLCQGRASAELQVRVSGLFNLVLNLGYSGGVWLQGALGDRLGLRAVTACAALLFFALALSVRVLLPGRLASLEARLPPPST
ncbi:MFS transporter [Myxococcus qinghaiensis]|uniref:MFS transporter n=1 Tax=Myxococcus qinghaiensis TaxID=2906758 RepID=UPI0020A83077|nr:MFS transporter [Myxococcus qinghaiensis]MCP3169609.1 MFS transporter [Myxococcus qinghaiensis]